uniref:SMAUG/ZCCHC2-like PHAT domain-containing protein n=1 Tax=Leptobrachium leishanense TaxID=445787 RepID=A0A8C5M3N4_9ANUR
MFLCFDIYKRAVKNNHFCDVLRCSLERCCIDWAVYEWSVLARDGLRDLYNPLELRFPGSCLEDLAASALHQLAQSACYSRFIAYLALLQLVRWLLATTACCSRQTLIFPWSPGAVAPPTGSAGELLLYTMASLHPAFSFFQRLSLRERLNHLLFVSDSGHMVLTV